MKKSNCLIWAWRKWRREGAYIVIRRSRFGWWPHFLHMTDEGAKRAGEEITYYGPVHKYHRWWPPILFNGQIKKGDEEENKPAEGPFKGENTCRREIL